ncbi:hypothetical protein GJ496_002230 [Pomphorhynchus laevis]|nr:hypothetical protein GJ496_002230 [Pomphorhynchus laevis]
MNKTINKSMTNEWKTEQDVKEYFERILLEYKYRCYEKKEGEGCFNLANYYENINQNFKQAQKLYMHACNELNQNRSCFRAGINSIIGKGEYLFHNIHNKMNAPFTRKLF